MNHQKLLAEIHEVRTLDQIAMVLGYSGKGAIHHMMNRQSRSISYDTMLKIQALRKKCDKEIKAKRREAAKA